MPGPPWTASTRGPSPLTQPESSPDPVSTVKEFRCIRQPRTSRSSDQGELRALEEHGGLVRMHVAVRGRGAGLLVAPLHLPPDDLVPRPRAVVTGHRDVDATDEGR